MSYEIIIREIREEEVQKFSKDTNSVHLSKEERAIEVYKVRIDGYKPTLRKEIMELVQSKEG